MGRGFAHFLSSFEFNLSYYFSLSQGAVGRIPLHTQGGDFYV